MLKQTAKSLKVPNWTKVRFLPRGLGCRTLWPFGHAELCPGSGALRAGLAAGLPGLGAEKGRRVDWIHVWLAMAFWGFWMLGWGFWMFLVPRNCVTEKRLMRSTAFIGPAHVNAALSSTDALCMHSAHKGLWQKLMMCNWVVGQAAGAKFVSLCFPFLWLGCLLVLRNRDLHIRP